jgi:VIT1/CCC1 family predicted Fe2+/Mn2+ transporter
VARDSVLIAGAAGLVAGAMSMAAGEHVSVSSQADSEKADLRRERLQLEKDPEAERRELAQIYAERGLAPELAAEVASQLMKHDALAAHARDELGFSAMRAARPTQAAAVSAVSFAAGGVLPLLSALFAPPSIMVFAVSGGALIFLAFLGGLAAGIGGAPLLRGAIRVAFWGALAMALTAFAGALFGAAAA